MDHEIAAQPLVDEKLEIKKYPGKGGWSYVEVPGIPKDKKSKFGMVRVKGHIDSYAISQYMLMPMGNGSLFLPIKAAIRKIIKKEAGDTVHIVLYLDTSPTELPMELRECLEMEPPSLSNFLGLSQSAQKQYLDWIYATKNEDTKAERILKAIERLKSGKNLYDNPSRSQN